MDTFSVLNYQGSKKSLLNFIHENTYGMINYNDTILDIFSGTCSVGYSYKSTNKVYANDSEYYSYVISKALLSKRYIGFSDIITKIESNYLINSISQKSVYIQSKKYEEELLKDHNINGLVELYNNLPTIWNNKIECLNVHKCYELFTTYYSGSYFGIAQAIDIDSIRCSIEDYKGTDVFFALLTSLFYAMKECVFSKDGHMAQPLDPKKNSKKLLLLRQKSIYNIFTNKFSEFFDETFITTANVNKVFNMSFDQLLQAQEIKNEVKFIYADPPYTDMQYSRYYHLLNVVAIYNYPKPSLNHGNYTKGLYVEGRYQSQLSQKSSCLSQFSKLIGFSSETRKNLAISFAYPENTNAQKTDRYVMNIQELIKLCQDKFELKNVDVVSLKYHHSNNRNSTQKKVFEYLILCKGR